MRWRLAALGVALCLAGGIGRAESGDAEAGAVVFQKCSGCHQIGAGAEHRIGPHLNGIFGRVAASHGDFSYSKSFQRAGAGGLEWHAETLDVFLENPRAITSGTRMSFRGIKDAKDRRDLIAYMRRFSDNPADIPEADPTAAATSHDVDPAILALVGDPDYGEYLSGECTTCHQAEGGDDGIPSIVLWPEEDFVVAMHAYKSKTRNHPVMQMVAGRLGDEEIAALAAYFARLPD
ncbi:c-type cytochrome [Roseobacter sinensis]|uniref:C-type cytochrome n=1 Tax=Roseobacter sinensis TaxID=2931391 RepID=A0ABT3BGR8_9RHOB|nr:c-type cytochrome [Roseobacter sp. WL0113]MCV3272781.1 c-type cytochrome [Roseobacter sp. WL0113]